MNKLDKQYQQLLQDIIDYGVEKKDRTGTGTKSIFGYTIRHNMSEGFPLLTTKKMAWKTMVTELLWFLRGDTNIKFLVDNNCHIWDGDAYKRFLNETIKVEPLEVKQRAIEQLLNSKESKEEFIDKIKTDDEFAKTWGELGSIYGKQWRSWEKWYIDENQRYLTFTKKIDQIANLINDLKTNPDSRRLMVNAWNVGELDEMVLPPCHYGFQVYTRELSPLEIIEQSKKDGLWQNEIPEGMTLSELQKDFKTRAISLMWNQRSVDTFLGLPFNIASYGLLLTILAKEVNMVPDQLIGNLGDTHLYLNHIEQAKEQIGRDLTDEERYDKWFDNNYETGMEKFFDPNNLPDFDNKWFEPTPKRTREPFELPQLEHMKTDEFYKSLCEDLSLMTHLDPTDFTLKNYQSHPSIKAPLSN
jgi:thymidylate synthase